METTWVQCIRQVFDCRVDSFRSLCDPHVLFGLLNELDRDVFDLDETAQTKDNWVLLFHTLKRIHTLLVRFLDEHGHSTVSISLDLSAIARNHSFADSTKLLRLMILAALVSKNREIYEARVYDLCTKDQDLIFEGLTHYDAIRRLLDTQRSFSRKAQHRSRPGMSFGKHETLGIKSLCPRDNVVLDNDDQCTRPDFTAYATSHKETCQNEDMIQLRRQYQELENQFLFTEGQLLKQVAQCSEQIGRIKLLEKQLAHSTAETDGACTKHQQQRSDSEDDLRLQIEELVSMNRNYKSKLLQNVNDVHALECRVQQLDAEKTEFRQQILNYEKLHRNFDDLQVAYTTLERKFTECDHELIELKARKDTSGFVPTLVTPGLPQENTLIDIEAEAIQSGLTKSRQPAPFQGVHLSVSDETHSLGEPHNTSQDQTLDAPITNSEVHVHVDNPVYDSQVQAQSQAVKEDVSADKVSVEEYMAPKDRYTAQPLELDLLKRIVPLESSELIREAIREQSILLKSKTIELEDLRRELANVQQLHTNSLEILNNVNTNLDNSIRDEIHRLCSTHEQERMQSADMQSRTRKLLKKQDELIKTYRQKYEALKNDHTSAAIRAEQALKDQKFQIYRKTAEEREARLKRENVLVAQAFYDLAARLQQSNLTLQRANESPQSFLAKKRLALGVLAPRHTVPNS